MGVTAISGLFLKIKETYLNKKFILFCCFGGFNTFTLSVFSTIFSFYFQENLSYAMGDYLSLTIAFFIDSYIIFKRPPSIRRYIRFFISYIPSCTISFLASFITINAMGLPQFWGSALAAVVGGPITFVIMGAYTFGKK